uniref:UDP-galactose:cyanidin 3-O-galactosyltransferase 1 n=1 Tax=Apium graveolens TaxID=4045 RepID=A0A346XR64_APIGR|nr:UDP-galactose:cyanidin 3-O-galactosyltransferase 1 [Apium graveolens]
MGSTNMEPHVAVLVFPFATHAGLLFGLVQRLARAAPNVKFTFLNTAKSNHTLFSDLSTVASNITPFDVYDGVEAGYVFSGKPQEDISLFLAVAADEFRRGVEKAAADSGSKITCLVADAFLWFSCDLAQEIGVPWVPLWTSGACSLSTHIYTDLIRQTVGLEGVEGRMNEKLNFIPGFFELRLGDLPGGVVFGNLESPFSVMLHKMGQTLPGACVLAMNSFEELDPDLMKDLSSKFNKILNVGPFNLTSPPALQYSDEYGCIPWLDKQNPSSVAYIGFGTVAMLPPNEIAELAGALESSGTPFIWSMKDHLKQHLPPGFLERTTETGKIVAWAPQVQVLSHSAVGIVITHGGWNSVLESIAAGVPLICRPFFGDHSINTWMVENVWKIGVQISGGVFTKEGTVHALEQVLSQQKGEELREQITLLKDLAFKAVGPNGSSSQNFEELLKEITKYVPN